MEIRKTNGQLKLGKLRSLYKPGKLRSQWKLGNLRGLRKLVKLRVRWKLGKLRDLLTKQFDSKGNMEISLSK